MRTEDDPGVNGVKTPVLTSSSRWQRVLCACARRPRPMCVIADIREVVQVVVRSVFAAPQPSALLALSRIVCEQRWTGYIWPVSRCARTKHVAGAETVGERERHGDGSLLSRCASCDQPPPCTAVLANRIPVCRCFCFYKTSSGYLSAAHSSFY